MNVVEVSEASEPARDSAVMSVRDSVSGNETTIVVVGDGDVKAPTKTDSMDSVSENSVVGQPAPAARISTSASGGRPWVQTRTMVAVAHQVEHRIVAPEVGGSRPLGHPNFPGV